MSTPTIGFEASDATAAQAALKELVQRYGATPTDRAEVIVALGGDGFMLETLHRHMQRGVPSVSRAPSRCGFGR